MSTAPPPVKDRLGIAARRRSATAFTAKGPPPRPSSTTGRVPGVTSSRTGMRFEPRLPFHVWKDVGARIGVAADATSWWLGDWLVFGRTQYGLRYRDAIDQTGFNYQTLRNYAVVARRFKLSRRRDSLSFQHHAEVCALADREQDQWLDLAVSQRWSKQELRRQLRSARAHTSPAVAKHEVRISVDDVRARRWREAADRSARSLTSWMVHTLDDAANSEPL